MLERVAVPRLNNNEDEVTLSRTLVAVGQRVRWGEPLFEVATDKANVEVPATRDGYVVRIDFAAKARVAVGATVVWLGDSPDEPPPRETSAPATPHAVAAGAAPTLRALQLLKEHGLSAGDVPTKSERLTAADVEAFLAARSSAPAVARAAEANDAPAEELSPIERAMLKSVLWQREHAAATYMEVAFDQAVWDAHARAFAARHHLLMDPTLGLMAYQLVAAARKFPLANSTIEGGRRVTHASVHLGFTMQVGETLYLAVLRDADKKSPLELLERLGELERSAFARRLRPEECSGATISFTSLARWGVSRHVPILAPGTSLIVAHSVPAVQPAIAGVGKLGVLGATYDHRLLPGHVTAQVLQGLTAPQA